MNKEIREALAELPYPGSWSVVDQIHKPTGLRVFGITYKDDNKDSDWLMTIQSGNSEHIQAIVDIINELTDQLKEGI